jgi:DNA-directed RNA polymerase subunit beta'
LAYRRARKVREQFERDRAQMIAAEEALALDVGAVAEQVEAAATPEGEAEQS